MAYVTTVKYYFWVSGKDTIETNTFGRSLPVTAIANYIENPKTSGIRYMAALRDDAVAVYNSNDLITGKDTIESVKKMQKEMKILQTKSHIAPATIAA